MRGGRRNLVVTVAAGVLAASGATAIAVAVAVQKHAPQPPLSAAGSLGSSAVSAAIPVARSSPDPVPKVVGPVLPSSKLVAIDIPAIGEHSALQYKDHFPTLLVYGNTDHAALRLITCGGPFDHATGHYLDNIVVFASLVGSH